MDSSGMLVLTFIAAAIPFLVCIFAAFRPSHRVNDVGDYYLYDRELDVDSFLKSTIGYSLQVAAIALFVSWTFTYGAFYPLLVCIAWGAGYWIIAKLVQNGKLDGFLGTARRQARTDTKNEIATIHGYVQSRLGRSSDAVRRVTILVVSLASVIGLGGTMLTEIFYGTGFFTSAIGIATPSYALDTSIHLSILFFGLLYVLWGGYKASVFIDRTQTPIAYVGFGVFALGVAVFATNVTTGTSAGYLAGVLFAIYLVLLYGRTRLLEKTMPSATWNKVISYFTFVPLTILSLGCLIALWPRHVPTDLFEVAFPHLDATFGFGVAGFISLLVANAIWQLIDISSLQRLQSLDIEQVSQHRENVVRAFRWIGIETALGWAIIIAAALLLKIAGFTIENSQVSTVIGHFSQRHGPSLLLLPMFIFVVVVFMVSTVSCFMSALSYIARYDIAPALKLIPHGGHPLKQDELKVARLTTLIVVVLLYVGYAILAAAQGRDNIATILYAVYAFQLAITPTVLAALFVRTRTVDPWAAIGSTVVGLAIAWWAATQAAPPQWLEFIGTDSWYVIPPIFVIICTCAVYAAVSLLRRDRAIGM